MSARSRFSSLTLAACLFGLVTTGCSGPAAPTTGQYRAVISLRGGELPVPLTLLQQGDQITLQVPDHTDSNAVTTLPASLSAGQLQAELPGNAGKLTLNFSRTELTGDLRLTDPRGQLVTLPVSAELTSQEASPGAAGNTGTAPGAPWRFVKEASTDNADISGEWQLEAVNPDHFNVPVNVHLVQTHDQVDGLLTTPQGATLAVRGQVHGDEVYLSTLGSGRAVLLKGKVTERGELQGESWVNLGTAHPWVARRVVTPAVTEPMQPVVLPWSVPLAPQAQHN